MTLSDITAARLTAQQITSTKFTQAKELVIYMGALQAQDYAMAKWAIGLRLRGSTEKQIEKALDKGEILRTHVLRPTWHIVPAADIYWMLALSAGKVRSLMKTMDKQLALTEKIYTKGSSVIAKCVESGNHADRDTIAIALGKAGIATNQNRLSHLLIRAELEGITCSGKMQANKTTYALLAERVPKKKMLSREESLGLLAKRYFTSHGPATTEDFSWWAGLSLTDARSGLEMIKSGLQAEKMGRVVYWCSNAVQMPASHTTSIHLLPAFDEYIISYKNRAASLGAEHHKKVLTVNGIFNPVIIVNGKVTGVWRRSFKKDGICLEAVFFQAQNKSIYSLIKKKAIALGQFLAMKITFSGI